MSGIRMEWQIRPSAAIGGKLGRLGGRFEAGAGKLAQSHAARAEDVMKRDAPWTDRTTYARGSLYGRAEGTEIELGTVNAEYGVFLEVGTDRMDPRPIILPTAEQVAPEYFEDCGTLAERLLGGGA